MTHCKLCEREVACTSKHHLLPKQKGGKKTLTVDLCQPCHKTIHQTFSNTVLAQQYTTVESLQNSSDMQGYLEWIRRREIEKI